MATNYVSVKNVIAVIILIIGLIWLIWAIVQNEKIKMISKWPRTEARIVSSYIEVTNNNDNSTLIDPYTTTQLNLNPTRAIYTPYLVYQYSINGFMYQSSNIFYGGKKKYSGFDIQLFMKMFSPGTVIYIYYNPSNFAEAYIYDGVKSNIGIIWGVIFIVIAIVIFFVHNGQKTKEIKTQPTKTQTKTQTKTKNTGNSIKTNNFISQLL